ncbi:hypothetical protein J8L85_03275 [Maribacter sp. MMG018]|uniref:hypothetical protein n=1 Tax=Maribacter sp. MMG018 TaxID=2822688 RepID=UPI001B362D1A|nr:hypothetical protein [Maribacter sp. MMG018]MBQ4913442.1 hypothetical protein [Maribacter sp. MMG018]
MELTHDEIKAIERYLDSKNLTHVDLRVEVVDHISESIGEAMQSQKVDFDTAFQNEISKWHTDLGEYSSYWLGLLWVGPRIVINKCVKRVKVIYLKTVLFAFAITGLFFLATDVIAIEALRALEVFVGSLYLLLFAVLLFFKYRIKGTGFQTSFSFLFNINAIAFSFMFVLYNPFWTVFMSLLQDSALNLVSVWMHAFTLAFSFFFLEFYNSHMATNKQVLI